jgi:ubiquinone/menaquinone biosynthesis C-methylase UbiE
MLGGLERKVRRLQKRVGGLTGSIGGVPEPAAARALSWIRDNHLPGGGIRVESGHRRAYPEVTGYIVPTLLAYGDEELAMRLTEWLICIQRRDGSFTDPDDGRSFVFDTGQVLRGLVAMSGRVGGAEGAARRAADYLVATMIDEGRGGFPIQYGGTDCPEPVQLYVLPPLVAAAERLRVPRYREAALRCAEHYLGRADCLRLDDLTHFLAYQIEALIDLGYAERVRATLAALASQQSVDGAVRGVGGSGQEWVCTPGLAQLAICWYKIDAPAPADLAMTWLDRHQDADGGFRGSYGRGAAYKSRVDVSWAPKFYLDAHLLRVDAFFARHASDFPSEVGAGDGRLASIARLVRPGARVLEVGCGKGRFLKALSTAVPDASYFGVDPAPALLSAVPPKIVTAPGTLENIPYPDQSFDVVFSVEAIEHSVAPMRAVSEMLRVTAPGGWIVIVDKHRGVWGRMECPPWERWPDAAEMSERLRLDCDDVSGESVSFDGHPASDGLMMAWSGRKRSRLSGAQWNDVLITPDLENIHVDEIRFNDFSEWGRTVVLQTAPGERVLEVGSGTGKISLQLALAGREVSCLDTSADSLAFTNRCAARLGLSVATVCGDATTTLPFAARYFDCVWSSGLLEHFTAQERREMLREWARVCRGQLISLVPNAASMAYRIGKMSQERDGVWPYGLEMPLLSLRDDYEASGLTVTREFSVGAEHSLNFLGDRSLKRALAAIFRRLSRAALDDWDQGYLLVTIGTVRDPAP